jgi:diacylglycerol kinase family enzyme
LQVLEEAVKQDDYATRKIVCIMGGDGSLATTIKFLRTSNVVDNALTNGKICFAMLPYGTGNDGA